MTLMVVQRFTGVGEAEAAAAALYAFGLDVCLADDEMVGLYWTYSNGVGGVKVMVWWEDLDLAGVLLGVISESDVVLDAETEAGEGSGLETEVGSTREDAAPTRPAEELEAVVSCRSCGAGATRVHRLRMFLVIAALLGGVGIAVGQLGLASAAVIAAAL